MHNGARQMEKRLCELFGARWYKANGKKAADKGGSVGHMRCGFRLCWDRWLFLYKEGLASSCHLHVPW